MYTPHTLPEGYWNLKRFWCRSPGGGRRIPRRGCPFFTKAHETLTRRPGESSCLSFPRTLPAGSPRAIRFRRGGSHRLRDFPGRVLHPSPPVAMAFPKGSVGGDLLKEAFQRGTRRAASPHVSGPVDDATNRVSSCPPVPVPSHRPVRASRRTSGPSTRGPTPSPTPETRLAALPRLRARAPGNTQGRSRRR